MKSFPFLTITTITALTVIFCFSLLAVSVFLPAANPFSAEVQANGACYTPATPEEEGDASVIHLPIREIAAMNMIKLSDIAEIYGWQYAIEEEEQQVEVTTCPQAAAEAEEEPAQADFVLGEIEFAGEELFQAPIMDDNEVYIGPELARLLVHNLAGDELKFITWLESDSSFYRSGDEAEVSIQVWNVSGQEQTLNFSSGQIYDIMIMQNGWVEWRWSDGRAFTMALQTKEFAPNEKMSWDESFIISAELESGDYQLGSKIVASEELPLNTLEVEIRQM